jgi:hypothetical protein
VADLITHTCVAYLVKAVPNRPNAVTFVLGTCLPDLLGRVPGMGLTWLRWSIPAIPEWLLYVWSPLHLPVGIILASYVVSFVFPEDRRRVAFLNLLGGGLLHLAVDVVQRHFGMGYLLLFPYTGWHFELGWISSEDTVRIVPVLLPVTLAVMWWRRGGPRRGAQPAAAGEGTAGDRPGASRPPGGPERD